MQFPWSAKQLLWNVTVLGVCVRAHGGSDIHTTWPQKHRGSRAALSLLSSPITSSQVHVSARSTRMSQTHKGELGLPSRALHIIHVAFFSLKNETRSLPTLPFPSWKDNSTLCAPQLWVSKERVPSQTPWPLGSREGNRTVSESDQSTQGQSRQPDPACIRAQGRAPPEMPWKAGEPWRQEGSRPLLFFPATCETYLLKYDSSNNLCELICSASDLWR